MAMSAEHRSQFAAFHRQWWRLQMSEKFSNGTKNSPKKTHLAYKAMDKDDVRGKKNKC